MSSRQPESVLPDRAPMSEVTDLRGQYGSYRQRVTYSLPGTVEWYRVATHTTFASYVMAGRVRLSAKNAYGSQVWEFDVNSKFDSATPKLGHVFGALDQIIDQVRVSTDATGLAIGLDIHLAAQFPATLDIEFTGLFAPLASTAAGATVLPTGNAVLNFSAL